MRFSEGIKRYNEETKKRIFDEMIAAAEKDTAAGRSHADNKTAVTAQQRTEDNIMRNTDERAKIRSSKGGIIAAACAVLVVGGGIFAAGHMNGGSKGISPLAGGKASSYTTDAEDEVSADSTERSEDSTAEDDTSSSAEEKDSGAERHRVDVEDEGTWRDEVDEDTLRFIDGSDFVGIVQITGIHDVEIDGAEYTEYQCSLTDENGYGAPIFKFIGDTIPNVFSLMQKKQDEALIHNGDKVLIYAKNGVKSPSAEYSLELTDDLTVFKWDNENMRYVNVYQSGHVVGENEDGIYGDYSLGLYEMGIETYFKDILFNMCSETDYFPIENWCNFTGIPFKVVTESGQDFPEGAIVSVNWIPEEGEEGITVGISDGKSYTGVKDKGVEDHAAIELNVRDKGTTIEEFANYDLELGGLYYEEAENTYGVVVNVTRKDGSAFSHEDWVENHMDFIYGDVQPIMELTESSFMESGLSWLKEGDDIMCVACVFHADKPLSEVDSSVPVTLQVNTVRRESGEEDKGLFEVTFNIDINDIK